MKRWKWGAACAALLLCTMIHPASATDLPGDFSDSRVQDFTDSAGTDLLDGTADSSSAADSGSTDTTAERDETETAASSSATQDRGMSVFGVVLTIIVIGAVVVLVFALIPRRREEK